MTIRYALDFSIMPRLISSKGPDFIHYCKQEGTKHITDVFNLFYSLNGLGTPFSADQFNVTDCPLDDRHNLLYIDLPGDDSGMQSIAYAIVYKPDNVTDMPVLYHVESFMPGVACLGRTDDSGHHNYGMAGATLEKNLPLLRRLVSAD